MSIKLYLSYGKESAPEGFISTHPTQLSSHPENTIEEIQGIGILEKVPDLVEFMGQIYYMLIMGGKAVFTSGYYGSANSYISPLIKRSLSEFSMNWTSKDWRTQSQFTEVETDIDFELQVAQGGDPNLSLRSEEVQIFWRTTRLNCVQSVHFTLTKK